MLGFSPTLESAQVIQALAAAEAEGAKVASVKAAAAKATAAKIAAVKASAAKATASKVAVASGILTSSKLHLGLGLGLGIWGPIALVGGLCTGTAISMYAFIKMNEDQS